MLVSFHVQQLQCYVQQPLGGAITAPLLLSTRPVPPNNQTRMSSCLSTDPDVHGSRESDQHESDQHVDVNQPDVPDIHADQTMGHPWALFEFHPSRAFQSPLVPFDGHHTYSFQSHSFPFDFHHSIRFVSHHSSSTSSPSHSVPFDFHHSSAFLVHSVLFESHLSAPFDHGDQPASSFHLVHPSHANYERYGVPSDR